jgi:predicted HD phosphohydrolase
MFTAMQEGTQEDWAEISKAHFIHQREVVPRKIMENLARLADMELGFAADQLTHSLMTATLARRAGASDEEVVAALCHDIGKLFSVPNHGPVAAEMLKPYVSEDIYHAIYWHQDFQGEHYFAFLGKDPSARERHRGQPWYDFAARLVDEWDAPAFDPEFDADPLESFASELERVFSRPKQW